METSVLDSQCGKERNTKRKNDGTIGKAILADHESKEDRPVGTVTNNDLEGRPLGTHPQWSGKQPVGSRVFTSGNISWFE